MLNIVFMGTPDFAKESLEAIFNTGHKILAVTTNIDKPKGRGMKMVASPVKEYAMEKGIQVFQPEKVKNNIEFIETIKDLKPDIIVVVAYGKILPKEILEIPKLGCINVHASLLPKYRGAAPIQWTVINGEKETGITTMYMDIGMDTGDIILQEKTNVLENETTGELWNRLSEMGANLLVETLKQIEENKASRTKQGEEFTVAKMLNKEMAKINWKEQTAIQIKNLVRGLNPILGAYAIFKNSKIKFWKVDTITISEFINTFSEYKGFEYRFSDIEPGTVVYVSDKFGLYIKAKDEIISVLEIQGENSRKMNILEFLRGNKIEAIDSFE